MTKIIVLIFLFLIVIFSFVTQLKKNKIKTRNIAKLKAIKHTLLFGSHNIEIYRSNDGSIYTIYFYGKELYRLQIKEIQSTTSNTIDYNSPIISICTDAVVYKDTLMGLSFKEPENMSFPFIKNNIITLKEYFELTNRDKLIVSNIHKYSNDRVANMLLIKDLLMKQFNKLFNSFS